MPANPAELSIKPYQPNVRAYAPRISKQEWNSHLRIISSWHRQGVTRKAMVSMLKNDFNFEPSLQQLNTKMKEWGFKVYGTEDQSGEPLSIAAPSVESGNATNWEVVTDNVDAESPMFEYNQSSTTSNEIHRGSNQVLYSSDVFGITHQKAILHTSTWRRLFIGLDLLLVRPIVRDVLCVTEMCLMSTEARVWYRFVLNLYSCRTQDGSDSIEKLLKSLKASDLGSVNLHHVSTWVMSRFQNLAFDTAGTSAIVNAFIEQKHYEPSLATLIFSYIFRDWLDTQCGGTQLVLGHEVEARENKFVHAAAILGLMLRTLLIEIRDSVRSNDWQRSEVLRDDQNLLWARLALGASMQEQLQNCVRRARDFVRSSVIRYDIQHMNGTLRILDRVAKAEAAVRPSNNIPIHPTNSQAHFLHHTSDIKSSSPDPAITSLHSKQSSKPRHQFERVHASHTANKASVGSIASGIMSTRSSASNDTSSFQRMAARLSVLSDIGAIASFGTPSSKMSLNISESWKFETITGLPPQSSCLELGTDCVCHDQPRLRDPHALRYIEKALPEVSTDMDYKYDFDMNKYDVW